MIEGQIDLSQKRKVFIDGAITHERVRWVNNQLLSLASKSDDPIMLSMHSGGGDVEAGLVLYESIVSLGVGVCAVVTKQADCIAALVLQACGKRLARRSASLTLYENHITVRGTVKILRRDLEKFLADAERRQMRIYEIFAQRTGKSVAEIQEQCEKGAPMTADEALAFGLLDKVLP